MFQLYDYAGDIPESHHTPTAPFPYVPVTPPAGAPSPLTYPLRPPKPAASTLLYSRFLPHLTTDPQTPAYFKVEPCSLKDLPTLHQWLNDPRVDQFWQEKGTLEQHQQFIEKNVRDPHVLPVIGSYVSLQGEGRNVQEGEAEQAVYAEVYWVKVRLRRLSAVGTCVLLTEVLVVYRRTALDRSCRKALCETMTGVRCLRLVPFTRAVC